MSSGSTKARWVPTKHNLVVEAVAALTAGPDLNYVFPGASATAARPHSLPARSPLNDLLGLAMIIADAKVFSTARGAAKFVTPTTTNLMAPALVPAQADRPGGSGHSAAGGNRRPPRE